MLPAATFYKELFERREGTCPQCGLLAEVSTEFCIHCGHSFSAEEIVSLNLQADRSHNDLRRSIKIWSTVFIVAFVAWLLFW